MVDHEGTVRSKSQEERRRIILDAALSTFAAKGFASARIEDIAKAAGVGKGTVYLYFPDKESLFKSLIGDDLAPLIAHGAGILEATPQSPRTALSAFYALVESEVLDTQRADLLRLMITEMPNFPDIAAYYHANLIRPGMQLVQKLLTIAHDRGELRSEQALRVPQMVVAPILISAIWGMLFSPFGEFDRRAAFELSLDSLFISPERETP
tara:strand:+ start:362 stop:991 length:630 start_codon:yes stop_codon:yes gene_type:complete